MYRGALAMAVVFSAASTIEAETGLASFYGGRGHHGEMTCARRTRPFGSIVRFRAPATPYIAASTIVDYSFAVELSMCR
jgi:hypothetical protein